MSDYLISEVRYQRGIALLEQTASPGRLLDVGCSVGWFVKAASERGYSAAGLYRAVERFLDLGNLGDAVAVAGRLPE
jgi:hypothetical protein